MTTDFAVNGEVLTAYLGSESKVIIPEGVKVIGEGAFMGTPVTDVTVPEGVTEIEKRAFWGCELLTEISLPEALRSIGDNAFRNCGSLMEVVIPDGVAFVGEAAFRDCEQMERAILPDTLEELRASTFSECLRLTGIHLPAKLRRIGVSCFRGCVSLTEIVIPEGVRDLDDSTFMSCTSLRSVNLPEGLNSIGRQCFSQCGRLMSIDVPDSVRVIAGNAFYNSGLMNVSTEKFVIIGKVLMHYSGTDETVEAPEGVEYIADHSFACCETAVQVLLPESVTEIAEGAFDSCPALKSVRLPKELKRLGRGAFARCPQLTDISLPDKLEHIGAELLAGSGAECGFAAGKYLLSFSDTVGRLELPPGTEIIADEAFARCGGIREVVLPQGLRTIGEGAFRWRSELTRTEIPASVTEIGKNAFANCGELEITVKEPGGILGENAFPDGARLNYFIGGKQLSVTLTWEIKAGDCPERRLWEFVSEPSEERFLSMGKSCYMIPCAICFYGLGGAYSDFLRKNAAEAVCYAADDGDTELFETVLNFGLLDLEQLRICIDHTIENHQTKQQVLLMRYRHDRFGETEAAERFKL